MSSNENNKLSSILNKRRARNDEKTSTYTSVFMVSILFIGIIITLVSWDIDNKVEELKCTSSALKTSNKIALSIGITFIVSSLSFYGCSVSCSNNLKGFHYVIYLIILFILGIVLIVLGSIIQANSTGFCTNTGKPSTLWVLGVILVLVTGFTFYRVVIQKKIS